MANDNDLREFDVLIVGGDGLLGAAMGKRCRLQGVSVAMTSRRDGSPFYFDLRQPEMPLPRAKLVFLFAGITSIQTCENEPASTRTINVRSTETVVRRLVDRGVHVIFPSTSLVFDGEHPAPPVDHPVRPRTVYGRQKSETEQRLIEMGGSITIVRISKVFSPHHGLIAQWRDDLNNGETVRAYHDRYVAPMACDHAIDELCNIAMKHVPEVGLANCNPVLNSDVDSKSEIYHLSGPPDVTYAQFATAFFQMLGVDANGVQPVACENELPVSGHTALGDPSHRIASLDQIVAGLAMGT